MSETKAIVATDDMQPQLAALFTKALENGEAGVGALEKLIDLHERMQRRSAELQFSIALGEFQAECPAVKKSSTAKVLTRGGSGYEFTFADLEEIIATVRPVLSRHGFSFTFDSVTTGQTLTCTCTLRHAQGHSMTSSFTLPTENASGASAQQKVGGALTYAKRQCLISVLGLALTEVEPERPTVATLDEEQQASVSALLEETGADVEKFLAYFHVSALAEIPATRYADAVRLLERKRKGGAR